MGCPSEVYIDETLTFSICTHDPDTGELTDADAAPVYWVYEDETGVSINASTPGSDIMALLDDAHTVGLYSETITCSVANGYEDGKSYTIYIKATVDSDTGGITYGFKARTNISTLISAIKTKTDSLPSGIAKNVALSAFSFYMVLASDHVTAATGKTLAGTISKDGGAFAALTNSVVEISNGMYKIDITQAEMNADVITLKFTETDCDQRIVVIYTT